MRGQVPSSGSLLLLLLLLLTCSAPSPLAAQPAAALPPAPASGSPAVLTAPRPSSPNPVLTVGAERYWLVTPASPLVLPLEAPGTLTLLVRRNLPAAAQAASQPSAELRLEQLQGAQWRPLSAYVTQRQAEPVARYTETERWVPSEEAIFGVELAAAGQFRLVAPHGAPLGLAVGLRFVPQSERLVLGETSEELSLEELAGLPRPAPSAPLAAAATPSPVEPATAPAADPARPGLLALSLLVGGVTQLVGNPAPAMLAGAGLQLGRGPLWFRLGAELLQVDQLGTTPLGLAEPLQTRLRYRALPLHAGLGFAARRLPLQPLLEASVGVTWASETVVSLHDRYRRQEDLLLFGLGLHAAFALAAGPGAVELRVGLRGHPAVLSGSPGADGPLGVMGEVLLGYRLDLLRQ